MSETMKRLIREDDGMEVLEYSIFGAVVALAAMHFSGSTAVFDMVLVRLRNAFAYRWFW